MVVNSTRLLADEDQSLQRQAEEDWTPSQKLEVGATRRPWVWRRLFR